MMKQMSKWVQCVVKHQFELFQKGKATKGEKSMNQSFKKYRQHYLILIRGDLKLFQPQYMYKRSVIDWIG